MKPTLLSLSLLVFGCDGAGLAPPMVGPPSLREAVRVEAHQASPSSSMTVELATTRSTVEVSMTPGALALTLRTGATPRLEMMSLPLGDLDVSAELMPPSGLSLREVSLGIAEAVPLEVKAASEDNLQLGATTPLRLEWSLLLPDGARYALGPAVTEPVSVDLEVERKPDGSATTRLYARCEGPCWNFERLARLENGQLHLIADSTLTPLAR